MRERFLAGARALAVTVAMSAGLVCVSVLCGAADARAADLPKATQKALADLKLDASVLDGLDAELNVPQAWLDGAAQEKEVIVAGTWEPKEFSDMTAPFKERYPFVKLRYNRAGTMQRTMQVLVALNAGRVIADVMTGIADATFEFKKMKALADLRELPGFKNLSSDLVAADGTWLAHKLSFRCMAYNTNKVKKEDLPKTWDNLVTDPRWRGGNLAVSNHAGAWLLVLWEKFGDKWGADFTRRLFQEVKPQRRTEGMTAVTSLTSAGEFYANVPAPEWTAEKLAVKGAPVDYHCPSPVPITVSQIAMLEKSPHKNGARLFINWMVSREGQLVQKSVTFAVPVHKALQTKAFLPFADTIIGKPELVRNDELLNSDLNKRMQDTWNGYWMAHAGDDPGPIGKSGKEE